MGAQRITGTQPIAILAGSFTSSPGETVHSPTRLEVGLGSSTRRDAI